MTLRRMPVSVGVISAGNLDPVLDEAIRRLHLLMVQAADDFQAPISVNVLFLGGGLPNQEGKGVRARYFYRKEGLLSVEAPISPFAGEPLRYLTGLVGQAIDAAESYLIKRAIVENLNEARQVYEVVTSLLGFRDVSKDPV